jgi:hypothetical protein
MAEATRIAARRPLAEGWLIALVALIARMAVVLWARTRIRPTADASYYQTIAERIAAGHGYTWLWPDGAVTYAAHYPVGYPALLAPLYRLAPEPWLAMTLNAVLAAASVLAIHRLLARYGRAATIGSFLVALHPGLIAYTPALMTEGVAGSLLICAAWSVAWARRGLRSRRLLLVGVLLGIATLLRPQLILVAPAFGWAAASAPGRRWLAAVVVTLLAVGVCLPWTLRNCARMGRCAFVSYNGGWNLLIGTNPTAHGQFAPLEVPPQCREVFDEAGKDSCFGAAARQKIAADPVSWLARTPQKLRATLDYCGAGSWYLHQSNPEAFSARAKLVLGVVETVFERALLILALLACRPPPRARRRTLAGAIVAAAAVCALTPAGWLAHLGLLGSLSFASKRLHVVRTTTFAALGSVIVVHAIFFGGGRYQLPALPFIAALAAFGLIRRPRDLVC